MLISANIAGRPLVNHHFCNTLMFHHIVVICISYEVIKVYYIQNIFIIHPFHFHYSMCICV